VTTEGFFDGHQRTTIEAAMARIIPSDDRPGAREAGCIDFLDRYLSGLGAIYAKPDGSGFETLGGRRAEAWQRRIDAIRARYLAGIGELDRLSRSTFNAPFARLQEKQQDRVLAEIESLETAPSGAGGPGEGEAAPLQQTKAEIDLGFFGLLCLHTRQGFYADPIYGGNKNRVGWDTIGFPGPASLADVHSGRYSTLAWFAETQPESDVETGREA
jgi:gluconate 2-dehydrogenase gamma chain